MVPSFLLRGPCRRQVCTSEEASRAQGLEIGWDPAAIFTVDKVFHGRAGQSGNPAGRAKSFDAADEFIRPLDQQRVHRVSNIGEIGIQPRAGRIRRVGRLMASQPMSQVTTKAQKG